MHTDWLNAIYHNSVETQKKISQRSFYKRNKNSKQLFLFSQTSTHVTITLWKQGKHFLLILK